ncbi:hypothetical protein EX30DRAFT_350598 [Ascodesmis nigricans]|uniref:Fungal-type protein kinase domain-containing protein n=1 Tax=Ascodesmis nigricans TaxID=341454 RepID=A0A4S2MRY9_9PEZI|nr:hypothetical protein EX30DRAFT_350598 [Ascodesmis nigricans]
MCQPELAQLRNRVLFHDLIKLSVPNTQHRLKFSHLDNGERLNSTPSSYKEKISFVGLGLSKHARTRASNAKCAHDRVTAQRSGMLGDWELGSPSTLPPTIAIISRLFRWLLELPIDSPSSSTSSTSSTSPTSSPPPMAHSGGAATPVKRSSASESSEPASNHLLRMGPLVADEIRGTVYSGFDALSFIDSLYPVCDSAHVEALIDRTFNAQSSRWKSWPKEPTEQAVIQWLQQWTKHFMEVFGADKARSRVRNSGHVPLREHIHSVPTSLAFCLLIQRADVIFIDRNLSLPCSENRDQSCTAECEEEADYCTVCPVSWHRVRIIGELKQSASESGSQHRADRKMVLTIAHRVREIFGTQPGRRYVHAFSLCGSLLRCFLFDRSGVFASEHFDIHSKPEITVRVFAAYLYGSPDWTGFDPTIQVADNNQPPRTYDPTAQDQGNPFITFVADGNTTQLYLDPEPLFLQPAIASRGSVCWQARRADSDRGGWEFVVKDQWRNKEREHEGVLLKRLEGIEGVAQRVHHEDVMINGQRDDTADAIRRGLDFDSPSVTEVVMPSNDAVYQRMAEGTGSLSNSLSSSAASLPRRPPPPALHHHNLRNKRSHSSIDNQRPQTPKRRCNDTFESAPDSAPYNRVHGRLVLRGVGRRLKEFKTREELLLAFRSAIVGYRNMLGKNTLHRDVSVNNIMISSPDPGGYLIDLDFAVPLDRRGVFSALFGEMYFHDSKFPAPGSYGPIGGHLYVGVEHHSYSFLDDTHMDRGMMSIAFQVGGRKIAFLYPPPAPTSSWDVLDCKKPSGNVQ